MSGTVRDAALPAPARTVPLEPGESVGDPTDSRWRVVRHVADGGFSSVYEVRPATPETVDRHGGAPRALKCVWGTPAELTAINSEAARTQDVHGHAGVLRLVTSFRFERSGTPHLEAASVLSHHYVGLVLELADEDLPTFGARVAPDERGWAAVFEQVAAGLEHIHDRRVVHGDIKPTNVLRLGARFAVADFGVSAPLESTRSAGIGLARTIAFWPPESASQGELLADGVRRPPVEGWRASQAGDVWALAVSAHRMLTGRHITGGTTPEQQYELVCLGKYAVDGRLGPGWRRLLEDCLVRDPRRRRVATSADLRSRLAELAVPPVYAGVPWPAGSPRLAALLDLDPAAGGPLLALSLDRPGGRVSGELLPADGVLPAAMLHLTEDVLPALAGRTAAAPAPPAAADPAATMVVSAEELERTRQQTASVSRQRDQLAADRDRLARSRDDLAADRDRLRRDHDHLARRLDRLEREAGLRRTDYPPGRADGRGAGVGRTDYPPGRADGRGAGVGRAGVDRDAGLRPASDREQTRVFAAARPEPTRVERGPEPRPRTEPPARAYAPVLTVRRDAEPARGWSRRSTSDRARPEPARAPARVAAPRRPVLRRTRWLIRRLVAMVALLVALAVLAVVGMSAFLDASPDQMLTRVLVVLDQIRGAGT